MGYLLYNNSYNFYEMKVMNMFIGLSKTLARFGGFRLGVGMRLTKNNIIWMSFIVMFVYLLKATWYMMIICFWIVYALYYGMFHCCRELLKKFKNEQKKEGEQA